MGAALRINSVEVPMTAMHEPLFSNAHAALTFAYNHSAQAYDVPAMNRAARGSIKSSGKGLGGVDGAAQAGMILVNVDALSPLHQAILYARFAPKTNRCKCCEGVTDDLRWMAAIRVISDLAASQALSTHPTARVLRDTIIEGYFGKKVVLSSAADRADVSAKTASNHRAMIVRWLRGSRTGQEKEGVRGGGEIGQEAIAMAHITDMLSAKGICA